MFSLTNKCVFYTARSTRINSNCNKTEKLKQLWDKATDTDKQLYYQPRNQRRRYQKKVAKEKEEMTKKEQPSSHTEICWNFID